MDLKQLAQTNLSRAVRFDVNGETFQVTLREPVGLEAMDFLRDFRAVAEVSRRKEAADFTYQGDDPDNEARRNEVAEEMLEAMLTLVFAWASPSLSRRTDEGRSVEPDPPDGRRVQPHLGSRYFDGGLAPGWWLM